MIVFVGENRPFVMFSLCRQQKNDALNERTFNLTVLSS